MTVNGLLSPALLALLLLAAPTHAATYVVDQANPACRDAGPGTEAQPWCTLHRATDGVPSREEGGGAGTFPPVVAGDTVLVKNGTYTDAQPVSRADLSPRYQPTSSGTATAPIAFRAYTPAGGPRHQPILTRQFNDAVESRVVFGSWGRSHVIWDGFRTTPRGEATLRACTGCVIEWSTIAPGPTSWRNGGYGLFQAVFLQNCIDCVLRNNRLSDVYWADHEGDSNASAVKLYQSRGVRIHNNEITNSTAGIYDKTSGVDNVYEFNLIHTMRASGGWAIAFANVYGGRVDRNVVRHNMMVNVSVGVFFNLIRDRGTGNVVAHNTMVGVSFGVAIEGYAALPDAFRIYNNAIVRAASAPASSGHLSFNDWNHPNPDVPDLLSDYNAFWGTAPRILAASGLAKTLAQWRALGFDAGSLATDPQLVAPSYRPSATSPLRGAGRVGGLSSGASVTIGAYVTDAEQIGVPSAGAEGRGATARLSL